VAAQSTLAAVAHGKSPIGGGSIGGIPASCIPVGGSMMPLPGGGVSSSIAGDTMPTLVGGTPSTIGSFVAGAVSGAGVSSVSAIVGFTTPSTDANDHDRRLLCVSGLGSGD